MQEVRLLSIYSFLGAFFLQSVAKMGKAVMWILGVCRSRK